jgi:dihydroorotase-like cyclic amidohydrolase
MRKLVLLEDCTSGIPGFETQVQTFLTNMKSRGMEISKSTEYFK